MDLIVRKIKQTAAIDWGTAVKIELEIGGHEDVSLTIPMSLMPLLVETVTKAADTAQRMTRAMPGEHVDATVPHYAIDVRSGLSTDGKMIALGFQVQGGYPVQIAMPEMLARKTIEFLEHELSKLDLPPQKLS